MAGRVTEDEKWRLLGAADLLCAPSLGGESFGMVLTEAFASSTPVVASDIAGYRDVVQHGTDGLLVPAADPAALGEALRDLALDPARREAMAADAGRHAERFSWPHVTDEVMEAYEDAVEIPAPERRGERARARLGLAAADRGPLAAPRPAAVDRARGARLAPADRRARGPQGGRDRRRRRRRRPDRAGPRAHRPGVDRLARWLPPRRLGAHGIRPDVRLDAHPRRGLARDPAGRPARHPGSPPRHGARHDDRRAHVGHLAGPPRRAVARADSRAPRRARPRPAAGGAGHARLPDACSTSWRSPCSAA